MGYYSAILSKLVGPTGHIIAYEVEEELADRAAANLAVYDNVEIRQGNAATDLTGADSSAGATPHPNSFSNHARASASDRITCVCESAISACVSVKNL